MTMDHLARIRQKAGKAALYALQKTVKWQYDKELEQGIYERTSQILRHGNLFNDKPHWQQYRLEDLDLEDGGRYSLYRVDTDKKIFLTDRQGEETDYFGRKGKWVLRGTRVYYDQVDKTFIKIFAPYSTAKGEARFLQHALKSGVYDLLCPHLSATIKDKDGALRGYAIKEGRILTIYEFERYVKHAMSPLIFAVTEKTGYYFYDLIPQNMILADGEISFIDLESVLPISWFDQGTSFAKEHLHQIDVGWEIQTKFASPKWYRSFLHGLKN